MKYIILIVGCLLFAPMTVVAAPCAAPAKSFTEFQGLVKSGCSPITFDPIIKGQTLTVTSSVLLAQGVVLDGESNSITLKGGGFVGPLIILTGGSVIQNITLSNPGNYVVSIGDKKSKNNKLANTTITNSDAAVYIVGSGNSIYQSSFSGNTIAIELDGGNNGIQAPVVTSYQVSKDDETQWVLKGLSVNAQAAGGTVDLYLADANSATPQGMTYKASAPVAADGSFTFTLPFKGKGTEGLPYTLLVTDTAGNTSAFAVNIVPETGTFYAAVDPDGDGVFNSKDNCPAANNPDQSDLDNDSVGDACDNCKYFANKDQADMDKDGSGDSCDEDIDGDGVKNNGNDNCPMGSNADQKDTDLDGVGDDCDKQTVVDFDKDGVPDAFDNCPATANADQADMDKDGIGDACDEDIDGDSIVNEKDNCELASNVDQKDANNDGKGDACGVNDKDGDGMPDAQDNCPFELNANQSNADGDATGDACDADIDGDSVENLKDNCPLTANPNQADVDVDALGDACEIAGTTGPSTSESPAAPATGKSGCSLVAGGGSDSATKTLVMTGLFLTIVMGLRFAAKRKENQ